MEPAPCKDNQYSRCSKSLSASATLPRCFALFVEAFVRSFLNTLHGSNSSGLLVYLGSFTESDCRACLTTSVSSVRTRLCSIKTTILEQMFRSMRSATVRICSFKERSSFLPMLVIPALLQIRRHASSVKAFSTKQWMSAISFTSKKRRRRFAITSKSNCTQFCNDGGQLQRV